MVDVEEAGFWHSYIESRSERHLIIICSYWQRLGFGSESAWDNDAAWWFCKFTKLSPKILRLHCQFHLKVFLYYWADQNWEIFSPFFYRIWIVVRVIWLSLLGIYFLKYRIRSLSTAYSMPHINGPYTSWQLYSINIFSSFRSWFYSKAACVYYPFSLTILKKSIHICVHVPVTHHSPAIDIMALCEGPCFGYRDIFFWLCFAREPMWCAHSISASWVLASISWMNSVDTVYFSVLLLLRFPWQRS